jgi:hypothetical protein
LPQTGGASPFNYLYRLAEAYRDATQVRRRGSCLRVLGATTAALAVEAFTSKAYDCTSRGGEMG